MPSVSPGTSVEVDAVDGFERAVRPPATAKHREVHLDARRLDERFHDRRQARVESHDRGGARQRLVARRRIEPRHRREQRARVVVLRTIEDVVDGALLFELASLHHEHAVRQPGDHAEIVGDQDDRRVEARACRPSQQIEDLRLHRDVERGGRLVGDQQLRAAAAGHRDHHALAHAARELVRIAVEARRALRGCATASSISMQRLRGARSASMRSCACSTSSHLVARSCRYGFSDVIGSWKIIEILRAANGVGARARAASAGRRRSNTPLPVARPLAASRPEQRHDDLALARARFADDAERLAGRERRSSTSCTACTSPSGSRTGRRGPLTVEHASWPLSGPSGRARRAGRRR